MTVDQFEWNEMVMKWDIGVLSIVTKRVWRFKYKTTEEKKEKENFICRRWNSNNFQFIRPKFEKKKKIRERNGDGNLNIILLTISCVHNRVQAMGCSKHTHAYKHVVQVFINVRNKRTCLVTWGFNFVPTIVAQ